MDLDGSDSIDAAELRQFLKQCGEGISSACSTREWFFFSLSACSFSSRNLLCLSLLVAYIFLRVCFCFVCLVGWLVVSRWIVEPSEYELMELMQELDADGNGTVEYTEVGLHISSFGLLPVFYLCEHRDRER